MPEPDHRTAGGRIVYLMGASGAGKDSLIDYALTHFPGPRNFAVVRRYVTRKSSGENSRCDHPLTPAEFRRRQQEGFFCMTWQGYGYHYGIARQELETLLRKPLNGIINGSRRYHPQARRQYPGLVAILVRADPGLRWLRLETRRRDDPEELATRLKKSDAVSGLNENRLPPDHILDNNGPLEVAGEQFISILRQL